jgi:signal transduction histidine kinase/CheY-like chemotaxis protein
LFPIPEEYENLKKKISSETYNPHEIEKINFQLTSKSGTRKDLVYSIVPIVFDGEKCFVSMIFDITEEKALQEQLAQSQKMDTVGQLAGGIAHDFNNMLSGILGSAEVIGMNQNLDGEVREYINIIINAAERASELTSKLLAFSRRGKIISSVIDIHECISSVIMLLKRSIDKRIIIKESLLAERFKITGDPTLIQNALLNLAINAKDAMPDGGSITIATREEYLDDEFLKKYPHADKGLYLEIDVSDTGSGISRENLPKIFDPFFTTKPVGKGTGLGLAAVYGTVKEHRGFIRVYSEENVGTVFRIYLPLDSERNYEKEKAESIVISGKGRIMVVDDESVIRNTAYGMLSSMGYDVLLAQDGEEALKIYESENEKIDLVILDMVMPKISGKETFERLKKIDKSVKVIFSSGFSPEAVAGDIRGIGAIGFIQKPYRIVELSKLIHEAIISELKA